MNNKAVSALVGLFVVIISILTIGLVLFIGDREFSGKEYRRYELLYDSSVKGLGIGAPVTLRGVKIGEVVTVKAKLYSEPRRVLNSVVVDIYPETIVQDSTGLISDNGDLIEQLIDQGLAAKLGLQSILTGMLYVEVDIFDSKEGIQQVRTDYPQIPTMPNDLDAILKDLEGVNLASMADDLQNILNNLSTLTSSTEMIGMAGNLNRVINNVDALAINLNASVGVMQKDFSELTGNLNILARQLSTELPVSSRQLNATLAQLQKTMGQLDYTLVEVGATVSSDSPLVYQLEQSTKDLGRASRAIEDLANLLEKQPNAVLFGRKGAVRQ